MGREVWSGANRARACCVGGHGESTQCALTQKCDEGENSALGVVTGRSTRPGAQVQALLNLLNALKVLQVRNPHDP
jgi:hypothetical protein